ncbi:MAG: glycosyltransferase [Lachnospiraceae bacterium]|nr:glycosyltransferase [Lachnospiraceae bacterium]
MFSILVVSLNPGEKLVETVRSVAKQTYRDYEVIVKDGGSKDDSLDALRAYLQESGVPQQVRILKQSDTGIYDGMNQATQAARGEYLYFLNCGDFFTSEEVLAQAAEEIRAALQSSGTEKAAESDAPKIFYGDILDALRGEVVASNPHINDFACYRNVPCHQACIYHYSLFEERGYDPVYRVRADYEHFLWCYFRRDARPRYIPVTLASYEGGGFSETPENRRRSAREHREITALYMSKGQRLKYRVILLATLAPLRTKMAESPAWSGFYNKCKKRLYRRV